MVIKLAILCSFFLFWMATKLTGNESFVIKSKLYNFALLSGSPNLYGQ